MDQESVSCGEIALIHPCEIVRISLGQILEQAGYQVTSAICSCESFLEQFDNIRADMVLVHNSQCESNDVVQKIIDRTGARIALLASSDAYHKDAYNSMLEKIAWGVTGFLDMDEPLEKFLSELDDILEGDVVVSKNFIKHLRQDGIEVQEPGSMLSTREIEILNLVGKGNTNKEVGEELFISENTVKAHMKNILSKLNLKNRQQLIAYVIRKNLIESA